MQAIERVESGGDNSKVGGSGEITALQLMPATFKAYSIQVLGYIAEPTKINAEYIAAKKIETWMNGGATVTDVSLNWNSGESATKCSKGINKWHVHYDSCSYIAQVLANL